MTSDFAEKVAGEITLSRDPGSTMRKWRDEFGASQHALAESMGVSHSVVSDYESGRRRSPGVAFVKNYVTSLIRMDEENGSPVASRYAPAARAECIIAMEEFPADVPMADFVAAIGGECCDCVLPDKALKGYTIVDSLKAIMTLGSNDYLCLYGWSTERALIFTDVHYGRSPMVAIRAHPLSPAMVVYQKPDNVDPLAIKLSKLEGIPLVSTMMGVPEIIENLKRFEEGIW